MSVSHHIEEHHFHEGANIFNQGDQVRGLWIIKKGEVTELHTEVSKRGECASCCLWGGMSSVRCFTAVWYKKFVPCHDPADVRRWSFSLP